MFCACVYGCVWLSLQHRQGEGHYVNNLDKVVGKLRVSQWRTAEDSCTVASGFGDEPEYCFADYCPSGELCFPTEDSETFGPGGLYHHKDNVHAEPVPVMCMRVCQPGL